VRYRCKTRPAIENGPKALCLCAWKRVFNQKLCVTWPGSMEDLQNRRQLTWLVNRLWCHKNNSQRDVPLGPGTGSINNVEIIACKLELFENPVLDFIDQSAQKGRDQLQLCLSHKQTKLRAMPICWIGTQSLNISPDETGNLPESISDTAWTLPDINDQYSLGDSYKPESHLPKQFKWDSQRGNWRRELSNQMVNSPYVPSLESSSIA